MLAFESRRVKPPDKNSWRAKYKRLSRLETDYSLILDDFEKNLGRLADIEIEGDLTGSSLSIATFKRTRLNVQ